MAPLTFNNVLDPQTQCCLFTLPAETRNEIYILVLQAFPDDKTGKLNLTASLEQRRNVSSKPSTFWLLLTCQLVYLEAHRLFYAIHHLRLDTHQIDCHYWRSGPTAVQTAAIEALSIRVNGDEQDFRALGRLRDCTQLKELHLDLFCGGSLHLYEQHQNLKCLHDDFLEKWEGARGVKATAETLSRRLQSVRVKLLWMKDF